MLLNELATLLPCAGRIAAPGLINSNENGPMLVALGATVIEPFDEFAQLLTLEVVKLGAEAALTVEVVVTNDPQTSVNLMV